MRILSKVRRVQTLLEMPPGILLRECASPTLLLIPEDLNLLQDAGCQSAHWKDHKPECIPEVVKGIIIPCDGDKRTQGPAIFRDVDVPRSHPVHREGHSTPVPKKVGIPLLVYK